MPNLIIDGMLSGTGVRDGSAGGYLDVKSLGLSTDLTKRIERWLSAYEIAHYGQFADKAENDWLDQEGLAIARSVGRQLSNSHVEYFSNARMQKLSLDLS